MRNSVDILTAMALRIHFTREQIQAAADNSRSYNGMARYLGYTGTSTGRMIKRWVEEYGISVAHFGGTGSHSGRRSNIEHSREQLAEAVRNSRTFSDVCRYLGRPTLGGVHTHVRRLVHRYELDTSHFMTRSEASSARYAHGYQRSTPARVLVVLPPGANRTATPTLRRLMLQSGMVDECALCRLAPEWNGLPLTLQVDHVNGNNLDNRLENLRFLCPNCHTQQPTTTDRKRRYYMPPTPRAPNDVAAR